MRRCVLVGALVWVTVFAPGVLRSQQETARSPVPSAPAVLPDLDARLQEVRAAQAGLDPRRADPELVTILARRERVLGELRGLTAPLGEGAPPSMPVAAQVGGRDLEALERAEDRIAGLKVSISVRERLLVRLQDAEQEAQRRVKQEKTAMERAAAGDPLAPQRLRLAEEELALVRARREAEERHLAAERNLLDQAKAARDWIEDHFAGREEELEKRLRDLARVEARWRRRLDEAKARYETAAGVLVRLESEVGGGGGAGALDRLSAARLAAQAWALEAEVAAGEVARAGRMRELWRRRWAALKRTVSRDQMAAWLNEARGELVRLEGEADVEAEAAGTSPVQARSGKDRASAEQRWIEKIEAVRGERRAGIKAETALLERLEGTLSRRVGRGVPAELARGVADRLRAVWRLAVVEVGGRQITVGRLVLALFYLVLGWWIVGRLSRLTGSRLLRRFALDPGAAAAVGTLVRYVLVVLVVVFAVWSAGIPLTIFTLAGGALAIGVGFGSQNLVANFISGLILLMERPVKPGDMVEVGGTLGLVEGVGARCTRVRTFDNVHVLVPNSQLLENPVTNWTYADDLVRVKLSVGVAYGSPVRQVEQLLRQALGEHPKVLADPAPTVFFEEFGDSALLFEAQCWITMRSILEKKRVLSDLRFRIDELFRDAGIVIAFPQQDVHVDLAAPLEVRLSRESTRGATGDAAVPEEET